jgi:hypothetical protein
MPDPSGFSSWLEKYADEESDLGVLARFAGGDPEWPQSTDLETYRYYLQAAGSPPEFEKVLYKAWHAYKSTRW